MNKLLKQVLYHLDEENRWEITDVTFIVGRDSATECSTMEKMLFYVRSHAVRLHLLVVLPPIWLVVDGAAELELELELAALVTFVTTITVELDARVVDADDDDDGYDDDDDDDIDDDNVLIVALFWYATELVELPRTIKTERVGSGHLWSFNLAGKHLFRSFQISLTVCCHWCCLIWRMNRIKCNRSNMHRMCISLPGIVEESFLAVKCKARGTATAATIANANRDKSTILTKPTIFVHSNRLYRSEEECTRSDLERTRELRGSFSSRNPLGSAVQWRKNHLDCPHPEDGAILRNEGSQC